MNKTKRLGAGRYEYRGVVIERNDSVTAGYYGAWEYKGRLRHPLGQTTKIFYSQHDDNLRNCVQQIESDYQKLIEEETA